MLANMLENVIEFAKLIRDSILDCLVTELRKARKSIILKKFKIFSLNRLGKLILRLLHQVALHAA